MNIALLVMNFTRIRYELRLRDSFTLWLRHFIPSLFMTFARGSLYHDLPRCLLRFLVALTIARAWAPALAVYAALSVPREGMYVLARSGIPSQRLSVPDKKSQQSRLEALYSSRSEGFMFVPDERCVPARRTLCSCSKRFAMFLRVPFVLSRSPHSMLPSLRPICGLFNPIYHPC